MLVQVVGKATDGSYDVCYCAGLCFNASQWTQVPGELAIPSADTQSRKTTLSWGSVSIKETE